MDTDSGSAVSVDVAIIGGGAAGLATAIFAARRIPQARILVLDGAVRLGAKILVSGGGRCNVTNRVVTPDDFCGGSRHFIRRVLAEFPAERAVAFFAELGVALYEEPDNGKLFPTTDSARTVLAALLEEAARMGVETWAKHRVTAMARAGDGALRIVAGERMVLARRAILAAGGQALPKSGSDGSGYVLAQQLGHTLVPPTPALVPLILESPWHARLSGISQLVELTVHAAGAKPVRVKGICLWTHFGASGPAVMDISRHWHRARLEGREPSLVLNFLPGADLAAAEARLVALVREHPRLHLHNALALLLPARVAEVVLGVLGIHESVPMAHLERDQRRRLAAGLVQWSLPVRDSRGYTYAEATAGGVPLSEVDPRTMASRKCPGLHLVGEILDVDGRIGGFNFQWAWSSAYVAAGGLAGGAAGG